MDSPISVPENMEWILLVFFAGLSNGAFALPMKFTTKWNWENTWGTFILWGFIIFPVLLAVLTIPGIMDVFREVNRESLVRVLMFGFLWGIGSVCFGQGIRYLGIGLAFSLNIGITIAIGSLLPLFRTGAIDAAGTRSAMTVVIGVLVILIGVVINGYAAYLRERDLSTGRKERSRDSEVKNMFLRGIMLCIVAGVMSPMLQFAFIHGDEIIKVAVGTGVDATTASNAVWVVALFGGFWSNVFYVTWLLYKNNAWALYKIPEAKRYHLLSMLMGLLWVITIACYGMAVSNLGVLGLSVGWAIFNSMGIVTANVLGLVTREWHGVRKKTYLMVSVGLIVLVLGTCVVATA